MKNYFIGKNIVKKVKDMTQEQLYKLSIEPIVLTNKQKV